MRGGGLWKRKERREERKGERGNEGRKGKERNYCGSFTLFALLT